MASKRRSPIANLFLTEWKHLGNRKGIFILYMVFFMIAGSISLATPYVIGLIFNSIQQNITTQKELNGLIFKIFLLLAITLGFWTFHGIGRVLERRTGFLVRKNYINSKLKKVLELPVKWHKDHHSGYTIDKINKGAGRLGNFSKQITYNVVYCGMNLFGGLIILSFIDLYAAILASLFSFLTFFAITRVDRKLKNLKSKEINFEHKVSASLFDYLSNVLTVITLRLKRRVTMEVNKRLLASFNTYKTSSRLIEIKWGFASIVISLMTVLILSYRSYSDYTSTGIIMAGTLYMLYGYLHRVGNSFHSFAGIYSDIVIADASIVGAETIDIEHEKVINKPITELPPDWEKISLKNLSFTYDRAGKELNLNNINFDLKKGQKIALVGESGSGKSTILSVLRGLHTAEKGVVYCNNKKLENGFNKLKHHITLIPQDPEIFNNTIKYNITLGIDIDKKELDNAVNISQFKSVLNRLTKGLKTNVLEKGVSLSGGEKQRLALARGILAARSSEILLMDEPTSSVDSLNEIKIHEKVFKAYKDKTIISSIHRLHLLNKFDYIYLFEKGRIVGRGSLHKIKTNPKFIRIWRNYMEESKKEEQP